LVSVVSRGGNYILNIGPKGDGSIVEFEAAVLRGTGEWLKRNREAIYGTEPQPFRKLDFGYATVKDDRLFLFVEKAPSDGELKLPGMQNHLRRAYLLGDSEQRPLVTRDEPFGKSVQAPAADGQFLPVVVAEFDGPLKVQQNALRPDSDGRIVLTPESADRFYNRNNEGYYDPATVRKERWYVAIDHPGAYRVEVTYKPGKFSRLLDITVDGRPMPVLLYGDARPPSKGGTVELKPGKDIEVTAAPGSPAERGAFLDVSLESISLIPVDSQYRQGH
jgi:alpha-L-fucosidase